MPQVKGVVVIPPGDLPDQAAQVVVRVEDVSRADAPSRVVGEQRFHQVTLQGSGQVAFEITVPDDLVDDKAIYSVMAHVDVSGSGQIERGDLISTQSYPVLTRGYPAETTVKVQKI